MTTAGLYSEKWEAFVSPPFCLNTTTPDWESSAEEGFSPRSAKSGITASGTAIEVTSAYAIAACTNPTTSIFASSLISFKEWICSRSLTTLSR